MEHALLGKSGLLASRIGFGCMSLGEDHVVNFRLLRHAFDHGINFFDTADLYQQGENEASLGKAFQDIRKDVIIATKVGNRWRKDGNGWDWQPDKTYILKAVEKSLQRLKTDYIDLYQLHGGTLEDPLEDIVDAFEILKAQGKIRAYGISSIRPAVIREYVKRSSLASVMMQYSLLDRRPEETCLDLLKKHQISVLARGSLARGLLIDKPPLSYLDHSQSEVQNMKTAVASLSSTDRPALEIALAFVLQRPAVCSAVTGIRTLSQLQELLALGKIYPLSDRENDILGKAASIGTYDQHR